MASSSVTNPDTLITVKVNIDNNNRRFKLPLRDLGANTLTDKLRGLLGISPSADVVFERYSDSAAAFVVLDANNASVYKQLHRAAKAKLKLRLKVTVMNKEPVVPRPATVEDEVPSPDEDQPQPRHSSLPQVIPSVVPEKESAPEEATTTPSVAEIQHRFEDLLISRTPCTFARRSMYNSSNTEVPVTRGAAAREKWFAELAGVCHDRQSAMAARRNGPPAPCQPSMVSYSVYCNHCNGPIPDEHFHCSTCEDGDFDLCQSCIDKGVLCGGEGHWMIKRFVKNGKVFTSTTETIAPRPSHEESKTTLVEPLEKSLDVASRTCNSCIQEFPEENFVTCTSCDDYDLCIPCHVGLQHGHNPKHAFTPAVDDVNLNALAKVLLEPGRNASHCAICDGCDKYIYGVRHKCLDCPDWDYCSTCIVNVGFIHPKHRFVPIYEPIGEINSSQSRTVQHHGIFCDGPLCGTKSSYITGERYKCAVCNDKDFCASCEASPSNLHNKTHPLIKFKTMVRSVNVTTTGDHDNGLPMPIMGDRRSRTTSKATETTPTTSSNAATQVQIVADLQPSEPVKTPEVKSTEVVPEAKVPVEEELVAHFVSDAVPDGTVLPANCVFEQTWILRNSGSKSWPAGCTVKFVGGDNMCAVDPEHPASVHELVSAAESTTCYSEVAPGQEFGFTVLMRTPNRPGKVISYWRLTGPNGIKFGHRLWCDVTVDAPVQAMKAEAKEEVVEEAQKVPKPEVEEVQTSQMIFPKLEKESPVISVHEEDVHAPRDLPVDLPEADDFEELNGEDGEIDDDATEDGFLTDEEYDILDASDEEYLADQAKTARK